MNYYYQTMWERLKKTYKATIVLVCLRHPSDAPLLMCRLGYCEKSTTCPFLYTAAVIKINTNRRFFIDITQIKKNTVSNSMKLLFPIEKNVVF